MDIVIEKKSAFNNKINELALGISRLDSLNIPLDIKNDVFCRLVADKFDEISGISILLYDSKKNALVNSGHFIDPIRAAMRFDTVNGKIFEDITNNKIIYDYLYYKQIINELTKISFSEFHNFSYSVPRHILIDGVNLPFNKQNFDIFCKSKIMEVNGENKIDFEFYTKYTSEIRQNDIHPFDPPCSKSAEFFEKHYRSYGEIDTQLETQFLIPDDVENKVILDIYQHKLSITIDYSAVYLLIPLIAYNRWIGIARVLLKLDSKSIDKSFELNSRFHGKEIKGLVAMFSLIIGNTYPHFEYYFKGIADVLHIDEKIAHNNIFKEFCDCLANRINCRAVLIRFGDLDNDTPRVKGWTSTINDYAQKVIEDDYFKVYRDKLSFIFESQYLRKGSILVGLLFDLNDKTFNYIKYLYSYNSDILNITTEIQDVFQNEIKSVEENIRTVFNQDVYKTLTDLKIEHFLIIKIPHTKNGYISFGNTKFRNFIKKDIDKVYEPIHRFGSELVIKQEHELLKKEEIFRTSIALFQNLYHTFQNRLGVIIQCLNLSTDDYEAIKKEIESDDINFDLLRKLISDTKTYNKEIRITIDDIYNRLDQYAISENTNVSPTTFKYDLGEFIREKVLQQVKRYPVKFELENKVMVNFNYSKLVDVLTNLIENALKYSFTYEERLDYDRHFNVLEPFYFILIRLYTNADTINLEITNWGKKIPQEFKENIFDFGVKCPNDGIFIEKESIHKGGMGLKFAKRSAELINARIYAVPDGIKTTIKLTWIKE